MSMKRLPGGEQPCIRLGMFRLRIPFIHVTPTLPEAIQAVCYSVLCFGSIATVISATGVSEEAAFAAAWFCVALYTLQYFAGEPGVPGWIAPGIPMTLIYLNSVPADQRIQALCALQLMVAVIFLFMGVTGLAKKIVVVVPPAIKSGIILGAALAAIYGEFVPDGHFEQMPVTCTVALVAGVFLLYSPVFKGWVRKGNKIAATLFKLGVVPALVLAMAVAVVTKEASVHISLLPVFQFPDLGRMYRELSPFSVGFPSLMQYVKAFPTACALYIIAFSELLVVNGLVKDARAARTDEWFANNADRVNIVAGVRNLAQALLCPFAPMSGPLGSSNTITMLSRYKASTPEEFYSVHGGNASATLVLPFAMLLSPIVGLCRPCASAITCICLVIQGFGCTEVGMSACRDKVDYIIAGAIAACMMAQGAAFGLAIGIVCYLFFAGTAKKKDDLAFNKTELAAEDAAAAKEETPQMTA